jgi:hypothetical protein
MRKKTALPGAFADYCGKETTGGSPLLCATPPAEYLIICSD